MKIRVAPGSLLLAVFAIFMFMPAYFSNEITKLILNILFVGTMIFLFKHSYKPTGFVWSVFAYIFYLIVISFIEKTPTADIHLIITHVKMLAFLGLMEYELKKNYSATVRILFVILLVYVMMDFASILLFPRGMYFASTSWNEWSSSVQAQWLYGNKNNRIQWYVMLILLACMRQMTKKGLGFQLSSFFILIVSVIYPLLVDSMTSWGVMLIIATGMIWGLFFKSEKKPRINTYIVYGGYVILLGLVITGAATFLRPLVEGVFGRDMTFTDRMTIWIETIKHIGQKPIFGWGIFSGEGSAEILGSAAFTSAHNQLLHTLWQGGVVGLLLLIIIFIVLAQQLNKKKSRNLHLFLNFVVFAIFIEMIFESILGAYAMWYALLLCYHFQDLPAENANTGAGRTLSE